MIRDEAALVAYYDEILHAYPVLMRTWGEERGIDMAHIRAGIRDTLELERRGNLAAVAILDQFEAAMIAWRKLECEWPCREVR